MSDPAIPGLRPLVTLGPLQGGWRRVGRQVGGSPFEEVADVWWLQAGVVFADLRVRRDGGDRGGLLDATHAFSGAVSLSAGTATFLHDMETGHWGETDRARLFEDGDRLVEIGSNYLERWNRIADAGTGRGQVIEVRGGVASRPPVSALARPAPDLRIVCAGDRALAIWSAGPGGAAAFSRREQGWECRARVGDQSGFAAARELL